MHREVMEVEEMHRREESSASGFTLVTTTKATLACITLWVPA